MRWMAAGLVLALAACGSATPAEEEAARQAAVAEVEAHQDPPKEALKLDPFRYPEIEKYELYGAGCNFVPDGGGLGAVALAQQDEGYLLRKGELIVLAADKGSGELPYLAREKYDGLEYSFTLELDGAGGERSGDETMDYRGVLTVRDADDRPIYQAAGLVQCGA